LRRFEAAAEMIKAEVGGVDIKEASNNALIEKITESFQAYGFEGTSLSTISKATGLIKASLYWRFPAGKEEMAEAALRSVDQQFSHHILKPIDEAGPVATRLAKVANRLHEFYGDGKRACLLDTLTLGGSPPAIQRHAKLTLEVWVTKFEKLARESGLDPATARLAAEDAVAALEGGLVLARVSGDRDAFRRAVESLGERLTKAARRI
jgi:AcrR family transcriptional regulator